MDFIMGQMANGKPGDHPLTDLLYYGKSLLPTDIQELIREAIAADPRAFDSSHPLNERLLGWDPIDVAWFDWEKAERLDEARTYFAEKLALARRARNERDVVADSVSAILIERFPKLQDHKRENCLVYPSDFPDQSLAGVRITFDAFLIYGDVIRERLIVETFPQPVILWNGSVVRRFYPGQGTELADFLERLDAGRYLIIESTNGLISYGSTVVQAEEASNWRRYKAVRHRITIPK